MRSKLTDLQHDSSVLTPRMTSTQPATPCQVAPLRCDRGVHLRHVGYVARAPPQLEIANGAKLNSTCRQPRTEESESSRFKYMVHEFQELFEKPVIDSVNID